MSRLIDAVKLMQDFTMRQGEVPYNVFYGVIKDTVDKQVTVEKESGWISCSERLPEERDSIFAKFKGTSTWNNAMFEKTSDDVNVTIESPNGERMTRTMHTTDGKWNLNFRSIDQKIVAWQPLPDPFKVADSK